MRKATWLKELMIVCAVILGFYGMQGEVAGQDLGNIAAVDNVKFDANAYHRNQDYNGQCVSYVKNARSELNFTFGDGYKGKSITDLRIKNAKSAGFEVNSIPRVGAAFLENVPTTKGGFVAHTGIVTSVELSEKDGKYVYIVNVKESNRKNDLQMGIRKVELPYPDTGWSFIHEKKDIYNTKQKEASEYVTQVFKNLGKELNDKEKKEYTEKLLSGAVSSEQIKATVIKETIKEKVTENKTLNVSEVIKKSQEKEIELKQAPTLTPDERVEAEKLREGVEKMAKFYKRGIIDIITGGIGMIPEIGYPISLGISTIFEEIDLERKLEKFAYWLVEAQLKTEEGREFLKKIGDGKVLAIEIVRIINKFEDKILEFGISPEVVNFFSKLSAKSEAFKDKVAETKETIKDIYTYTKDEVLSLPTALDLGTYGLFGTTVPYFGLLWPKVAYAPVILPSIDKYTDDKKVAYPSMPEVVSVLEDIARSLAKTKVDVFFLADNTGSMGGLISSAKSNALTILNKLAGEDSRFSKIDMKWGVGRYYGDPTEFGETPTTAYRLQQTMTTDKTVIQNAINQWSASGGGDWEEANFFAIQQIATEGAGIPRDGSKATNQKTGWRSDAAKVIVVFGDAPSWQNSVNEKELRQILQDNNVHVVFIDTNNINAAGSNPVAWDAITGTQLEGAAEELADGSSGSYVPLADGSKIVEAVLDGVYDAITDNTWAGGQMTRIDSSKIWRSRTASSITGESSNNRNNWDFTLRYPGQTNSTFSFSDEGAAQVGGKQYYKKNTIGGGTNIFGSDMSANSTIQFTSNKDFFRFMLRNNSSSYDTNPDNNTARVEAYFGHKTSKSNLPSSGIHVYDLSATLVSPYNKKVFTSGDSLPLQMSINWATAKVYASGDASLGGSDNLGLFLGSVDRDSSKVEGSLISKSSRIKTSDSSDIPRFIKDSGRGNTNYQIYGESEPVGLGGTFSVNWYDENKSPSSSHMISSGFMDEKNVSYTTISDNEVWKGFAVGFVHNRNDGSLAIATNSDSNDVRITLNPSSSNFTGDITTSDGTNTYNYSALTTDKNVYVSPKAFGAVRDLNGIPAYIATKADAVHSDYNYTTWGLWSYDLGTSPDKTVHAFSPWIAGRLTPYADIPTTGTATYNGKAWGQLSTSSGQFTSVDGTTSLTANFGSKTLTGTFDNLKKADGAIWVNQANVNANWGGANAISGTISGSGKSGNINGAFFGPGAQEIGGNWTLNGGGDKAAGIFTGKK